MGAKGEPLGARRDCVGANKACVGAKRCLKRASVGNIVPSGGSLRVDGCWAVQILSTFLSDRDRVFSDNKAWGPQARSMGATEGLFWRKNG